MNREQWICIKETKCTGLSDKNVDKTCYVDNIYYLEEVPLDLTRSFWHVDSETEYLGIIFSTESFINLAKWRDKQINSILDE